MLKAVGIDLGGTFIKGALVNEHGTIEKKEEIPTQAENGPADILQRIEAMVHRLCGAENHPADVISGVGIGVPGFVDDETGIAVEVVNLGWRDVPVVEPLSTKLHVPVYMDNDANAAALGEAWVGAGRNHKSAVLVTLGTGVGGGIVIAGRVLRGAFAMAGEIGHLRMEHEGAHCNCGGIGCLETVSSATGVVRLAQVAIAAGKPTSLPSASLTAADVFQAREQGDEVAIEVVNKAMDTLARALSMVAVVVNPEVFVIGGGMAKAGTAITEPLQQFFSTYALPRIAALTKIELATLGNDAGIVGAARLALFA